MRYLIWFLLLFLFLDAAYLTYLSAQPAACGLKGCQTVLQSPYAQLGIIPLSLLGLLYPILLAIAIDNANRLWLIILNMVGVVAASLLIGLQIFVLGQICPYCLTYELVVFVLALIFWRLDQQLGDAKKTEPTVLDDH